MDEGVKRKLVGAAALVVVALVVLPQITPKSRNAEYLSESVPLEVNIPAMEMTLPRSLSIPVSVSVSDAQLAGESVPMSSIKVDTEVLPVEGFEIPATDAFGQAVVWQIQVASFAKVENAIKLRNKLREAGYKAFEQLTRDHNHTRVFVGPTTQKSKLKKDLIKINNKFGLQGKIIPFQNL